MISQNSSLYLFCLTICMAFIAGCRTDGGEPPPMLGGVEIRDEQMKGQWPAELPRTIYVSDFALEAEHMEGDQGVRGLLPGKRLKNIEKRLPHPMADSNPEEQAKKIVDAMSQSLVDDLNDRGFIARRLPGSPAALPRKGWLVQGVFTEVDEGNRIKRAVIGFGRGATRMEVQVAVSDLSSQNPKNPFIVFGTVKKPKKMPGAAVTLNPYVAAAKFVMEKNATEKDIRKTAEQIADEIVKHNQKFKEQAESKLKSGKRKP
jgi:predicted RNA-binding protein with PIN domain